MKFKKEIHMDIIWFDCFQRIISKPKFPFSEEEIAKAFADSELLAKLTQNKTRCGQLLITNDKKLSKDAYALNSQESCRGYKIMVCYIDREGMEDIF